MNFLKAEYPAYIDGRFNAGKNITVIHGDLHPGHISISKSPDRQIKFTGLQALRMGLCTEDLAMLIALHISGDKNEITSLLDCYYQYLSNKVSGYSHETFMRDFKLSVAENLFFPIRLINRGIYDFRMRDKALHAFEMFVAG